jgi:hypothetical protein
LLNNNIVEFVDNYVSNVYKGQYNFLSFSPFLLKIFLF